MFTYFLVGMAFVAGFLVVFGLNLFAADARQSQQEKVRLRLEEETRLRRKDRAQQSMQFRDLYEIAAEEAAELTVRKTLKERFLVTVEQAGVQIGPGQIVMLCLALATLGGLGAGFASGSIALGICMALLAGGIPILWVRIVRSKRQQKLQSQLPDAFDLMSRTMRAGQTISQAFQSVAEECSSPLADEFGMCYDQQNLGLSTDAAMRDLSRRTDVLEIKIFVLAVMIHRQTGGNLSDLLEKLAIIIRERFKIQGMIRALTAEGKFQAYILLGLPVLIFCALFVVNRPYIITLIEYPIVIVVTLSFMAVGAFWMNKIIDFDF